MSDSQRLSDHSSIDVVSIRLRAYVRNEGLYVEARCMDQAFMGGDNIFNPCFLFTDPTLVVIANRRIDDEEDAAAVARASEPLLLKVIKRKIDTNGLSSRGAKPRLVSADDLSSE